MKHEFARVIRGSSLLTRSDAAIIGIELLCIVCL